MVPAAQGDPGEYEAYVDLVPGEWTKIRIEVRGDKARLFVHGQAQPTLVVNDVKSGANGRGRDRAVAGPRHARPLPEPGRDASCSAGEIAAGRAERQAHYPPVGTRRLSSSIQFFTTMTVAGSTRLDPGPRPA